MARDPELLMLAVTRMRTGVCVAGMARTTNPVGRLRWVRPVKDHGALLAGDIRYASGRLMRAGIGTRGIADAPFRSAARGHAARSR